MPRYEFTVVPTATAAARGMVVHRDCPPKGHPQAKYYQARVRGPVYRAGDGIPSINCPGHVMRIDPQQLRAVARAMNDRGPVLWNHDRTLGHAGYVAAAHVDDQNVLHAEVVLYPEVTWARAAQLRELIETRLVRSFSLGWDEVPSEGSNGQVDTRFVELSVCEEGFFPAAKFAEARCSGTPPPPKRTPTTDHKDTVCIFRVQGTAPPNLPTHPSQAASSCRTLRLGAEAERRCWSPSSSSSSSSSSSRTRRRRQRWWRRRPGQT